MTNSEKIEWLKSHFFADFISTREKVFNDLSDRQSMFCICGKLATGLHELNCSKFRKVVDKEVLIRLSYLLPKKSNK